MFCLRLHLLLLLLLLLLLAPQAVVLGVSCYFDVQDMMEKRVRSRFSNRKIFLPGLAEHKVGTITWLKLHHDETILIVWF